MLQKCDSCLCALSLYELDKNMQKCDLCTNDFYCRWCGIDTPWRRPIREYILIENKEHIVIKPDVDIGEMKFIGSWE